MLGWAFIVEVPENADPKKRIAYWEDGLFSDLWLTVAIASGEAEVISKMGGYPDRYRVKTSVIPKDKVLNMPDIEWCVVEVWDQS